MPARAPLSLVSPAAPPRVRQALLCLAPALLLSGCTPLLSGSGPLGAIVVVALVCLAAGLLGLRLALRRRQGEGAAPFSLLLLLALAYLLPAAALYLPLLGWPGAQPDIGSFFFPPDLEQTGLSRLDMAAVWLFWWQALALLVFTPRRPASASSEYVGWRVAVGLLAGLGLGVLAAFLYSLTASLFGIETWISVFQFQGSERPLAWFSLLNFFLAITLAPWAEERFFRGLVWETWQARLGPRAAQLASAALFATLQFRPLLWLPAFVVGLVLVELIRPPQRGQPVDLLPAVLAHAVCNAVLFLLGPALVL